MHCILIMLSDAVYFLGALREPMEQCCIGWAMLVPLTAFHELHHLMVPLMPLSHSPQWDGEWGVSPCHTDLHPWDL